MFKFFLSRKLAHTIGLFYCFQSHVIADVELMEINGD